MKWEANKQYLALSVSSHNLYQTACALHLRNINAPERELDMRADIIIPLWAKIL